MVSFLNPNLAPGLPSCGHDAAVLRKVIFDVMDDRRVWTEVPAANEMSICLRCMEMLHLATGQAALEMAAEVRRLRTLRVP